MARKPNEPIRSIADEPIIFGEMKPGSSQHTVISPPDPAHPALDTDPREAASDTQNARVMNTLADQAGVPFSGHSLGVTEKAQATSPGPAALVGVNLMTIGEEAAQRAAGTTGQAGETEQ